MQGFLHYGKARGCGGGKAKEAITDPFKIQEEHVLFLHRIVPAGGIGVLVEAQAEEMEDFGFISSLDIVIIIIIEDDVVVVVVAMCGVDLLDMPIGGGPLC